MVIIMMMKMLMKMMMMTRMTRMTRMTMVNSMTPKLVQPHIAVDYIFVTYHIV